MWTFIAVRFFAISYTALMFWSGRFRPEQVLLIIRLINRGFFLARSCVSCRLMPSCSYMKVSFYCMIYWTYLNNEKTSIHFTGHPWRPEKGRKWNLKRPLQFTDDVRFVDPSHGMTVIFRRKKMRAILIPWRKHLVIRRLAIFPESLTDPEVTSVMIAERFGLTLRSRRSWRTVSRMICR